jgi:hypothetical protein
MEIPTKAIMKIREAVLVFAALPLFGQQATPHATRPSPPAVHPTPTPTANHPLIGPAPQFTQLEQVIAKDISQKQADLQQEINDFLREIRTSHPGYEFMNGNLVPVQQPPAPPKPEEKK